MKKHKIYFFTIISLVLFSCTKNEKFDDYSKLTAHSWKLFTVLNTENDSIINDCQIDDKLRFSEKEFQYSDLGLKCGDEDSHKDKWKFIEDGKAIQMESFYNFGDAEFASFVFRFDIIELTDSTLVLKDQVSGEISKYGI